MYARSMDTVSFTAMADGTRAEYEMLAEIEAREMQEMADRALGWLRSMDEPSGYKITRLEHSLQSATRAHRAGEEEEFVVACLLHDVGDILAPANHSEVAAAVMRPYVSERTYWIIKHHGLFQTFYYYHHFGKDRNERDRLKSHQWYQDTVDFCENYDQNCFDPDYESEPLEFFEPMVRRFFREPKGHV